jgi:hypothetical protein
MVQRTRYGGAFPYVAELGRPAVAEVSHVARRSAAKAGSQGPDRRAKLPEPAAVPFTALADRDIGTCFLAYWVLAPAPQHWFARGLR